MKKITLAKAEKQTWEYIKKYYDLPFLQVGQIAMVDYRMGTVIGVSTSGAYLIIYFANISWSGPYHPTSIAYLDAVGKIIKDFRG